MAAARRRGNRWRDVGRPFRFQLGQQAVRLLHQECVRFGPGFCAIESTLRSVAKSSAHCLERNPPEICIFSFVMRRSRSAWFVNRTLSARTHRLTGAAKEALDRGD